MSKNKNRYTQKPAPVDFKVESFPGVAVPEGETLARGGFECAPIAAGGTFKNTQPGMIKTIVVAGNIFNVENQDTEINKIISKGYEYLDLVTLSSMEIAVRFRKI